MDKREVMNLLFSSRPIWSGTGLPGTDQAGTDQTGADPIGLGRDAAAAAEGLHINGLRALVQSGRRAQGRRQCVLAAGGRLKGNQTHPRHLSNPI